MICPKCKTEMIIGKAINTGHPAYLERAVICFGPTKIDASNIELVDVLKCPKCGHSEYIDNKVPKLKPSTIK